MGSGSETLAQSCSLTAVAVPVAPVLTKCQEEVSRVPAVHPGMFRPKCDEDGNYMPLQCYGSIGFCWCVFPNGTEVPHTRSRGRHSCSGKRWPRRQEQEGPGPGRQGGHSWGQPLAVRPPVCPSHPRSCLIRSVPVKAPPGHAARPPDPRPSSLTSRPHCTAPACHPASIPAWPGAGPAARWARTSPPRPLPAVPQAGLR